MARSVWDVPLVVRGKVIHSPDIEWPLQTNYGEVVLRGPDPLRYVDRMVLADPIGLADLYDIRFEDALDYLTRLGRRLKLSENGHLQEAFELSRKTSYLSDQVLQRQYEELPKFFERDFLEEMVRHQIGVQYLDGWVEESSTRRSSGTIRVRAFGARSVHLIPGNVPTISAATIARNVLTRSDAIIKTASNDVLTAIAVARTMAELDPQHPLTRHVVVAYWKGGYTELERIVYDVAHIDKLVAWGGAGAMDHIRRYIQPGLDVVHFGPKVSISIIGEEAFKDDATLLTVAERLALDVGALDQEACFSTRIAYVAAGTGAQGRDCAERLGRATFEAIQRMPRHVSGHSKYFDPELRLELDGLRLCGGDYSVFGGKENEGAIIVSYDGAPVDFAASLSGRVCNIVAVDTMNEAVSAVSNHTQTVGIFPEDLKFSLRDRLALQGAQRLVPLGRAAVVSRSGAPQDGAQPLRRMCKWVTEEMVDTGGHHVDEVLR